MENHVVAHGDYMPHGMCLLWEPWLVLLWAGSDFLISLSYTLIPLGLFNVLRRHKEVPPPALVVEFAALILLCGVTHFFMIVTLWADLPGASQEREHAEGFGTTLLVNIVLATLGSRAERRFEAGGMIDRLLVPLGAITERAGKQDDDVFAAKVIEASFGD